MKILCVLLSFYVIVLSTKPCCADYDCQTNVASKKERSHKAPAKEKDCPGCSPFFTCGSCFGFIVSKPMTLSLPVTVETHTAYFAIYQQPHIEKVTLSVWLPPKIS